METEVFSIEIDTQTIENQEDTEGYRKKLDTQFNALEPRSSTAT